MGRRRSGSDDAAIALAVAAVVAVGLGVYWLVVGLSRLVRTLARPSTSPSLSPTSGGTEPASADTARSVALEPELVPYGGPLPRGDERAVGEGIKAAFIAWARSLPGAPRDASILVRSVHMSSRTVALVQSTIEGRRIGWRNKPTGDSITKQPAGSLDPWLPAVELTRLSTTVSACATCAGAGTVRCSTCDGTLAARCPGCDGAGKVYGLASNGSRRLMNCRRCGKKGTVNCPSCARGRVECAACAGMGRVKRCGEAESWTRLDHRWLSDPYEGAIGAARRDVSPTREMIEIDGWVVSEVEAAGVIELDRLPGSIPAQDRKRIVDLSHLVAGERVDRQRVVVFEIPAVDIAYGTPKHQQTVEFVGRRLLAPRPFADRVMHRRASLLRASFVALLAVPLTLGLVYLARGAYFASTEVGGAALALTAAALLVYQGVRLATLGRRRAFAWFSLALLPVAAATALAIRAEPDLRDAGRFVGSGKLDEARRELEALGSAQDAELASLYADVRLAELERATSADAAARWLALLPIGTLQRAAGQDNVDRRWIAEAAGQAKAGDPFAVAATLSNASPEAQKSAEASSLVGEAHILAGRRCLTARDHECAFEQAASAGRFGNPAATELHSATFAALRGDAEELARTASTTKELGPRVDLLRQAKVKLLLLARYATEGERRHIDLAPVETRLGTDEPALEKQRAREEAASAREAERERKQAERIARAYERQARREAARRATEERRAISPVDSYSGGGCCKHCSKGKPCGDTCIARNKTCHVGRGCAC